MDKHFIAPELTAQKMDIFLVRTAIRDFLKEHMGAMTGQLLDIGCGKMPYRKMILDGSAVSHYVGLDIDSALEYEKGVTPDFHWDGVKMPFEGATFDCALATEVLEHCPQPAVVMAEAFRVLKPGGVFLMTVPFLWPLHEVPHDEYRYTPFSLERLLSEAGFSGITIRPLGGWNASLAQMLALWARRAPMSARKRRILSLIILPLVRYLISKDRKPSSFPEGTMVTGLSCVAYKK